MFFFVTYHRSIGCVLSSSLLLIGPSCIRLSPPASQSPSYATTHLSPSKSPFHFFYICTNPSTHSKCDWNYMYSPKITRNYHEHAPYRSLKRNVNVTMQAHISWRGQALKVANTGILMENSRITSVFLGNYYLLKNKKYLTNIKQHRFIRVSQLPLLWQQ